MHAVHIPHAGGPEVLEPIECGRPKPASGEVLIRVYYSGINRHDCNQRAAGRHPNRHLPANIPGLEVFGEVVETGSDVASLRRGDHVCALVDGGGYAEYCLAEEALSLRWPVEHARKGAALPEGLFAAWYNLVELARLESGQTVLIHGGTSGVGVIAIQLARARGARVIATCRNTQKAALSRQLGAHQAFVYRDADFADQLLAAARDSVDVILDLSGLGHFALNLALAACGARVIYLSSSGPAPSFDAAAFASKQVWITASRLRPLPGAQKARLARNIACAPWLPLSALQLVIDGEYPLFQAAAAHARMESGEHAGKILLSVSSFLTPTH
jgi:NADPH:quinone reductase-like Zn-dependent oxidoreductase